jgi:hypothetical protein
MPKCESCGEEVQFPFVCNYCGKAFCMNHRLPESHDCLGLPKREFWYQRQKTRENSPEKRNALSFVKREPTELYKRKRLKLELPFIGSIGNITSLLIWVPLFWLTVGLVFLLEQGNPAGFYQGVPQPVRYLSYGFAVVVGLWSGYRIFLKCDVNPSSDRGIFGLKLLSFGVLVAAVFTLIFGISLFFLDFLISGSLLTKPQVSLAREMASTYLITLSFVLIVLSGYLVFKFERRSGIIVYRR